jgi:hypothetical protein
MKKRLLTFACLSLASGPMGNAVFADMVPPTELIVGFSVVALIVCGLFVAVIVAISVLVIRSIKKNRAPKDQT